MKELIIELIKQNIPITLDVGIVKKVSGDVCQVESLTTEKDFFKCRLNAIEKNENEYVKFTPKINSTVVFGIFKDTEKAIIISTSEVEKIEYKIDKVSLLVDKNGFGFEAQNFNLKDVLNQCLKNQNAINKVIQKIVVANGVGPSVPELAQILISTNAEIEKIDKILQ